MDPRWAPGDPQENGISAEFVEFSPDGSRLLTGNGLGEAVLLDAGDGSVVRTYTYITAHDIAGRTEFDISGGRIKGLEVECGYFFPRSDRIAVAGNLNGVKILERDGDVVRHLTEQDPEVDGMAVSPDGRFFAHAARRAADVYRTSDWTRVYRVPHGTRGAVNSIDFSPDGRLMASAGGYGHVLVARTDTWEQVGDGLIPNTSSIKSVRFSPDGRHIAAGYGSPADRVVVFRSEDLSVVADFPLFYIEAVAWTSDGRYLMAGGRDGRGYLQVFRASDWERVGEVLAQEDAANIEYIDVHGDRVAVAGEDSHVRVFRVGL